MRPVLAFIPVGGDTQTVTTGSSGTAGFQNRRNGFFAAHGSISDGTSNLYGGAAITALYWDENGGSGSLLSFVVNGSQPNAGWTQMVIDGTMTFLRSAASYGTGATTSWTWNGDAFPFPFGADGTAHTVIFS